MKETRGMELQEMLEARRRELEHDLGVKLRDVRENSRYEGEMRGGVDTAETSDVDLRHDIDIALRCRTCEDEREIGQRQSRRLAETGRIFPSV